MSTSFDVTFSEELKRKACSAIDEHASALYRLSHDIWSEPELGYAETKAHARLTDFLQHQAGFENIQRHYVVETGFRAAWGGEPTSGESSRFPHVAVLCEYDALPDIGHACGHNLIAEVGIAAAIGIKAALQQAAAKGRNIGKLTVLGTPAEEGGGGKIDMLRAGAFEGVHAALMAHPGHYHAATAPGILCNAKCVVKYSGRASHAAATPWLGVNALDAAVNAYCSISTLRQQMKPEWRVHAIITKGGTRPNIIPEEAELSLYARTPALSDQEILKQKIINCLQAAAQATGCEVTITWSDKPYYSMISNVTLTDFYIANARQAGLPFAVDHDEAKIQHLCGSTDMGNVSHVVPSVHPVFRIGDNTLHTRKFAEDAGDISAQSVTLQVAKAIAMTAIDVYCQPDKVDLMAAQLAKFLA